MRKKVIISTCDQCGTEEWMDFPPRRSPFAESILLPEGWLHVTGQTGSSVVFALDLCAECIQPALEIAGAYKRRSA